jgi:hypothetical protein
VIHIVHVLPRPGLGEAGGMVLNRAGKHAARSRLRRKEVQATPQL